MPANCGVATVFRATQVSPLRFGGGILRRCDGLSGDTSVAPTLGGGIPRRCDGCSGGDGRRGAIYDARCRNGTTRPRHCARRCTRCFRPIAALRRPARGDRRRGAIYDARCRNGTTRPRHCARRCARCFRPIAALRRLSGRHKCRPYVFGMFVRDIAADGPVGRVVRMCRCDGRRAVMDVGAPFMTPGAGTAQPVRGIARCGVRGDDGQLRCCVGIPGDTSVAPTLGGACGGHVVCRRVETVGRLVFPVAVTVFPDGRSLLLVTTSVNAHRLMDFRGGEETFCSTKLD